MQPTTTFKSDLIVKSLDNNKWQIVSPFYFYFDETNKNIGVTIEEGFITDFASIPRAFWSILPPVGLYTKAAVVHDYLYQNGEKLGFKRKFCDEMFLEAMRALRVSGVARYTIYSGVRILGWKFFIKKL